MKTAEECKKIAAEILGVEAKELVQFLDGVAYGFTIPSRYDIRDIAIDPRTGKEISLACR